MGAASAPGRLADLAEAQSGLVTTRQAEAQGVARRDLARLVRVGGMERIAYGVYRIRGAPRPRLLELRAAWLQLAPGVDIEQRTPEQGVVSHASAASIFQVGSLDPSPFEFSVPLSRRLRSRRDDVVIHRVRLAAAEIGWFDQMVVTIPIRLVADLCAASLDAAQLAGVVSDVLGKGLASRDELIIALAAHADGYGLRSGDGRQFLEYLLSLVP
jgi:predicted transcriptional regulator of viral defense system